MHKSKKRLKLGEGKISGILSVFLGVLCLVGMLCFQFPEQLTTPEFREIYTAEMVEYLMLAGIFATFLFALLSFLRSIQKATALLGVGLGVCTVLLGGIIIQGRSVAVTSWSIGLDWLILDLLIMAVLFVPLELFFPKRKLQSKFHEEWRTDLIYFAISHLAIQFIAVLIQKPANLFFGDFNLTEIQNWVSNLPFVLELFLALFITDLFQYTAHRFFHTFPYFWKFHAVHHSIKHMDWLAGSRLHFVDILITRSFTYIPLYVLGFSTLTFSVFILFLALHTVLIHSNTRVNFGFLKYIITTPQYHYWHHCKDPKYYGKNFAVIFPFIDKLFGTYYLPKHEWPKETGLVETNFPKGFLKQLVFPFIKNPSHTKLKAIEKSQR